jgi:hypothetical protein
MATSKLTAGNINPSSGLVIPVLDNDPGDGTIGELVYVNGRLKYFDGTQWYWIGDTKGGLAVTSNLILRLDASEATSYPGSGGVWYDLSGAGNNFNVNSTAYNSSGKYFDFNGSYGCAKNSSDISLSGDVTYVAVTRVKNSTAEWRTLTRSYSSDHHVIIQSGGWNIGMYDNDGAGFIGTGYSQQSLPGYSTNTFDVLCWRWNATSDSPTYDLNVNGVQRGTINNSSARYNRGFGSIGAYHNGNTDVNNASQWWGDIKFFAVYNRRLTDTEVQSNYTSLKTKFATN